MNELLIIRYRVTRLNSISSIQFNNNSIVTATSSLPVVLASGVYLSPPLDFSDLSWFLSNDLRIDKFSRAKLLRLLINFPIEKVTVI